MKTKNPIYWIAAIMLFLLIIIFKRIDYDVLSVITAIADVVFIFGLFIKKLVNTKKKRKVYKISFIFIAILSLINEFWIKNEGGNNWGGFGFDLSIKILLFILIFSYLKNEK